MSSLVTGTPLAAVVMAAGLGTRMHSSRAEAPASAPGPAARRLDDRRRRRARADPLVVVTSPGTLPELEGTLPEAVALAVQETPRGTGDAAASARPALESFKGDVVVLAGDAPLLSAAVLAPAPRRASCRRTLRRRCSPSSRTSPAPTGASSATDGSAPRDRRGADASPGAARDSRGELVGLRLRRGRAVGAASRGSAPTMRRVSSTSPTPYAIWWMTDGR